MKTRIYYFSGTGNSLDVARRVSALLDGEMVSIASAVERGMADVCADIIGIVFPCYLAQIYGIPLVVEKFCRMLKGSSSRYVFAVCTYGGFGPFNAWPTLENLSALLRDSDVFLSGAFSIKLPLNNLDYDHIPVPVNRNHQIMFDYTDAKLQSIAKRVLKGKKSKHRLLTRSFCLVTKPLFSLMGKYVYASLLKTSRESADSGLGFRELIALTDRSIHVDDSCNGCGLCEKICPVRNITLTQGRPTWNHHCEMCLACDEWCPRRAIHHWCKTRGKDYRHPDVRVADMLAQRDR